MAFLLDLLIRGVIDTIIAIVASLVPHIGQGAALIGAFAVEWLYPVIFELTRSGATPGKRSLGLRVVMDSGLPVTPAASFTRNLLRTADFLPLAYGFGILSLLLNRDCKRLGDLAAGTLVVHDKAVVMHDTPPRVESLTPARTLSMSEQAAIRSWAGRAKRLTPARYEELAKLALSVLPPKTAETQNRSPAERLLGVAQWLMAGRESGVGTSGPVSTTRGTTASAISEEPRA